MIRRLANFTPLSAQELLVLGLLFLKNAYADSFFMRNGACAFMSLEASKANGRAFLVPPSGASHFFIKNANDFESSGGFSVIIRRLHCPSLGISMEEVSLYTHVFAVCRFCCTIAWMKKYIREFFDAMAFRLKRPIPEDFKQVHVPPCQDSKH